MARLIFITGGVVSSLGKGLASAALGALQSYGDPSIGSTVIDLYNNLPDQVRDVAQSLIASRKIPSIRSLT